MRIFGRSAMTVSGRTARSDRYLRMAVIGAKTGRRPTELPMGPRNMLITREGEEIVCPKGTVCGHITRAANAQIVDGDFTAREFSYSPTDQRYLCACCGRAVAAREPLPWRVHLRRGWVP